ncbi:MAG: hypothetical protein C4533_03405 [Candidatus Omnitrophota bacterium]|jgi:ribosome-associated toxin RatA of RatAB toxin-antitoxin module|nr:MAG: hypothetical protein C4533_03405 [Candidatus Omnitrophota bacterium]
MVTIEASCVIKKPKEKVFEILRDMESYPSFMRDVKNLKVIKSLSDTKFITSWETEIEGAPVNWKEEDNIDEPAGIIKFNMVEGYYQSYQGIWHVKEWHDGSKLTLKADFDWGIPILEEYVGSVLKKKAERGLTGMVLAIKNKAENSNV